MLTTHEVERTTLRTTYQIRVDVGEVMEPEFTGGRSFIPTDVFADVGYDDTEDGHGEFWSVRCSGPVTLKSGGTSPHLRGKRTFGRWAGNPPEWLTAILGEVDERFRTLIEAAK